MDNLEFETLKNYFNTVTSTGYVNSNTVKGVMVLVILNKLRKELCCLLTDDDKLAFDKALNCVIDNNCLIPNN